MASFDQKLRTLYLMEILLERTDDEHMLNASELCTILDQEYGISTDRRTIYTEMEILEKFGLDIQQKKGKCPGYYIGARDFELPELKLLVDAVQSSKFITEKKSKELIQKLEKLCCKTDAEMLSRYVFIVNRPKTENETVYYNVDYIHTAIYENKQIKFHYAEWTVKKELKFKKNGAFYVVSPWALTWDDENYYLVAYDAAAGIIKHYRVDKMRDTEIMEADRKGEESFKNFDLAAFAKKTFGMYGGVDAEVTLECRNELAGVVIDRFGHDVWMCPHGEDHFRARVPVAVSSQFFGWITGIGSGMRIVGPEDVRQQYKEYLQSVIQNYMDWTNSVRKRNNRKFRFYDTIHYRNDIIIIAYKIVKNGRTYMKIIIINGSARKGNTLTAINALIKGASEKNEIEVIEPDKLQIAPCKGCGACQCHKGCVDNDDTNPTIDKIAAADMILFTTPVYWWGMSAQLKLVIDKCYCRGLQLKNKKVGVIAVGGSPVDSIQYELINKQFDCMADYLSWDMLFQKSYYASEKTDLAKDENSLKELEDIGKNL